MFRSGFFTSDSWTINGDGFAIGNKAEGSDFLAKIMHKILGDGAAEVTTTGFQVVKKTGLTCTVKPFFVCKNGYIAWNTEDTDITFTSSASEQVFYVGVRLDLTSNEFTDDNAAAYATFVSATDVAAAKITITANAVTLTDGMIEDLRYDEDYCGQIDEYRERSLALIAELEDALALLISGGVPAHASTHATGETDAIAPSDIGAADETHATAHESGGADEIDPANLGTHGVAELASGGKVGSEYDTYTFTFHSANYTLAAGDEEHIFHANADTTFNYTIPPNVFEVGVTIPFYVFSGTVTFVAGAGVTLEKIDGYASVTGRKIACIIQRATNYWIIVGGTQ